MSVSLNTNSLISATELELILQKTFSDSDYKNTLINISSQFIEDYTNRIIKSASYTSYINGNGMYRLFLPNYPITAITSIDAWNIQLQTSSASYTANTDFIYNGDEGWIYLYGGWYVGYKNYKVVYTAGYSTVPDTLKIACAELSGFIDSNSSKLGLSSETIGDYSYQKPTAMSSMGINGLAIPGEILSFLQPFIRMVL